MGVIRLQLFNTPIRPPINKQQSTSGQTFYKLPYNVYTQEDSSSSSPTMKRRRNILSIASTTKKQVPKTEKAQRSFGSILNSFRSNSKTSLASNSKNGPKNLDLFISFGRVESIPYLFFPLRSESIPRLAKKNVLACSSPVLSSCFWNGSKPVLT